MKTWFETVFKRGLTKFENQVLIGLGMTGLRSGLSMTGLRSGFDPTGLDWFLTGFCQTIFDPTGLDQFLTGSCLTSLDTSSRTRFLCTATSIQPLSSFFFCF